MVITQVQFGSIYAAEHEPIETLEDAIIYQHNQREWIGKDQQWQEVYDTQLIGYNAQKNHETSRASRDGHQANDHTHAGSANGGNRSCSSMGKARAEVALHHAPRKVACICILGRGKLSKER
jgi:hypothetical protein